VDIDAPEPEADGLDPESFTARIELACPAGARRVTVPFGLGLAMAAVAGAPVRCWTGAPCRSPGDDLLSPFLDRVPPVARPTGGRLAGRPARLPPSGRVTSHATCGSPTVWTGGNSTAASCATATAPGRRTTRPSPTARQRSCRRRLAGRPAGSAALVQTIFADDYRGATVVFRGEFRVTDAPRRAGLLLRVNTDPRRDIRGPLTESAALADPDNTIVTIGDDRDWVSREVTARVPGDCDILAFGIFLAGPGRIELRHAELVRAT